MLGLGQSTAGKRSLETKARSLELTEAKKNKAMYHQSGIIVNRTRNGYETAGNIKVVSINNFKQLDVANKVDYVAN